MNATSLPLPLELTKPVLLAGDLDTQLQTRLGGTYDPKTQLSACNGGGTTSNNNSASFLGIVQVDVNVDVQVDDNDIL